MGYPIWVSQQKASGPCGLSAEAFRSSTGVCSSTTEDKLRICVRRVYGKLLVGTGFCFVDVEPNGEVMGREKAIWKIKRSRSVGYDVSNERKKRRVTGS